MVYGQKEKEAEMKKFVERIQHDVERVSCLLAGLLGIQPVLDPIPARVERGNYNQK
jgi:hypothetical protein